MNTIGILVALVLVTSYISILIERQGLLYKTLFTFEQAQKEFYSKEGLLFYALALAKYNKLIPNVAQKICFLGREAHICFMHEAEGSRILQADILMAGRALERRECKLKKRGHEWEVAFC